MRLRQSSGAHGSLDSFDTGTDSLRHLCRQTLRMETNGYAEEALVLTVKPRFADRGSSTNHLLQALGPNEGGIFRATLEGIEMPAHAELHAPNARITHIYFPDRGTAVSIIAPLGTESGVEVGTVGDEGFVGLPVLFGVDREPFLAVVQVAGNGWRTTRADFNDGLRESAVLRSSCLRFAQAYYVQVGQASACNRAHTIAERCARWLLLMNDRADSGAFALTQDHMASMLGVRRAGVSVAAGDLQRAGLINYQRGHITVIDRRGLEAAACPCYGVIRDGYVPAVELSRG